MKILFLTDTWFPNMTTNAICVKNISKELLEQGNDVYICAYGDSSCPEEKDNIRFSYIRPSIARRLLNLAQYKYKRGIKAKLCSSAGKTINRIRRGLLIPFYPIASFNVPLRWLHKFSYLNSKLKIDTIISVVAPDESLYAGYKIKKKYPNVKWIVYYIDSGTNILNGTSFEYVKKQLHRKAIKWENKVLKSADKIIVMDGHSEYYKTVLSQMNSLKLHVADVPLLTFHDYSEDEAEEHHEEERWVYTGNMNGRFYDPKILCEVFIEYCKLQPAELHLYGPSDHFDYLEYVQKTYDNITWHGMKSHDEVLQAQREADVLVYFICETLDSVSGKLFEYLSHGKPIIYIGPSNDINSRRLSKYYYGLALSKDNTASNNAHDVDVFLNVNRFENKLTKAAIASAYPLCLPRTTANIIFAK